MRNNFKALVLHLIIVILSFLFLINFVATGPKIGYITTNMISRIFIVIALIFAYIFSGTLLDINKSQKYDFFAGTFIAIIGIVLWYYTFSITGRNLNDIPEELSEYWISNNLYHSPFIFVSFLFELPNMPLISLIANIIPPMLMGVGMKYKRKKNRKLAG